MAAEDLRLRLLSGDVEAQDRWVTPGEGIEIIPLRPEDWVGLEVRAEADGVSFRASLGELVSDDLGGISVPRFSTQHGHNIFLRHVYRIWPTCDEKQILEAVPDHRPSKQLPTKRPKGIGPRVWLVAHEVLARAREGGTDSKWIDLDALLVTI